MECFNVTNSKLIKMIIKKERKKEIINIKCYKSGIVKLLSLYKRLLYEASAADKSMRTTFAEIVYAHLFCACNVRHFLHTWAVSVQHSIANKLKCINF